jgi:glycosyltransferase involved in cell wall biosynthesis
MKKIKILHVINSLHFGGAESLMRDVINSTDKHLFENKVCYLRKYGEIGRELDEKGIKLVFCKSLPRIRFFRNFGSILQSEKPCIIHTHVHLDNFWIANCKKFFANSELICHVQNQQSHKGVLKRWRAIIYLQCAARLAYRLIAVSNGVFEHLVHYFKIPRAKLQYIPNAIDTDKFDPQKVVISMRPVFTRNSPNTIIIGSVGNISAQKDYRNLIHAVRILSDLNPDLHVKVLIAGASSPLQDDLEKTIRKLALSDRIYFLGSIDWVPEFLKNIDIYVQSSRFEGLPCSVIEAMSMEKPVVATDVAGTKELVKNGFTGLLVPPGDSKGLALTLEKMISLGSKREELGVAGRKSILKKYSIEPVVDAIQEVYKAAMSQ